MQTFQLNIAVKLMHSQLMATFFFSFSFKVAKTANISQINQKCYNKC